MTGQFHEIMTLISSKFPFLKDEILQISTSKPQKYFTETKIQI